jgi:hypothetical protein
VGKGKERKRNEIKENIKKGGKEQKKNNNN